MVDARARGTGQAGGRWGLAIAALGLVAAVVIVPDLGRAGYSPDEEFTTFAVQGIARDGMPLLPSGLLYDRGIGYSYAAWLATLAMGEGLAGPRAVSAIAAALALALIFRELRPFAGAPAAAVAALLAGGSLPFWVSATTARFYAPFLLAHVAFLAIVAARVTSWSGLACVAFAAACARWTHELAFLLAAVPVIAALLDRPVHRRAWLLATAAALAGLAVGQAAIFAVHALAPPSNGDVMVRRFFLWQVLNLFERPPLDLPRLMPAAAAAGIATVAGLSLLRWRGDRWSAAAMLVAGTAAGLGQLGLGPIAALAVLVLAPPRVGRIVAATALAVLAASLAFWTIVLAGAGFPPGAALARLAASAFVYPLDMFTHLATRSPWLASAAIAALVCRARGLGGDWTSRERALHALWLGWVLWFGVIESGITVRYLLFPVVFMSMAIAVDLGAIARAWPGRLAAVAAAGALACAAIIVESWRGPVGGEARAAAARPTFDPAAVAGVIGPGDLVASDDELGGVLVAGRLDAWLVLDDFFRERFVVMRGGEPTGTYTGVPAESSLTPLFEHARRTDRRLVVVDVLRDVPGFGPTRAVLPRQLAREGLRGQILAEADGVRVVQIVPGAEEGFARLDDVGPGIRIAGAGARPRY
ncbi:MAG: glycosyltransferase family 39 protein [Vicinamibacterales bacterium]